MSRDHAVECAVIQIRDRAADLREALFHGVAGNRAFEMSQRLGDIANLGQIFILDRVQHLDLFVDRQLGQRLQLGLLAGQIGALKAGAQGRIEAGPDLDGKANGAR